MQFRGGDLGSGAIWDVFLLLWKFVTKNAKTNFQPISYYCAKRCVIDLIRWDISLHLVNFFLWEKSGEKTVKWSVSNWTFFWRHAFYEWALGHFYDLKALRLRAEVSRNRICVLVFIALQYTCANCMRSWTLFGGWWLGRRLITRKETGKINSVVSNPQKGFHGSNGLTCKLT